MLAGPHRVRLRLISLGAQPGDDRNAIVAEHHETVMQVAHQSCELKLEDVIERFDDRGGFCFVEFGAHEVLANPFT